MNCGSRYDCAVSLQPVGGVFVGDGKSTEDAQNTAAKSAYNYLSLQNGVNKKAVEQTAANVLTFSGKATTRKKAKRAVAKAMLDLLENSKQEEKFISPRKFPGIGLLKRAMILRKDVF